MLSTEQTGNSTPPAPGSLPSTKRQKSTKDPRVNTVRSFFKYCATQNDSQSSTAYNTISLDSSGTRSRSNSTDSQMSTSSSGSVSFTKGDIDNILKKYFDYSDSEIFTRTSNELFYFLNRRLNYDSTSNYTQDVINLTLKANTKCSKNLETMIQFIGQSLTKYVVDQVQLKLKYKSVELREPAAAADEYYQLGEGVAPKPGKESLTQPLIGSVNEFDVSQMPFGDSTKQTDIPQLKAFLLQFAHSNNERLTKLDQSALSIVINKMAIDICSNSFFHPNDLENQQQKLVAIEFIEFIKHELNSSKQILVGSERLQAGLSYSLNNPNKASSEKSALVSNPNPLTDYDESRQVVPTNWFSCLRCLFDFRFFHNIN